MTNEGYKLLTETYQQLKDVGRVAGFTSLLLLAAPHCITSMVRFSGESKNAFRNSRRQTQNISEEVVDIGMKFGLFFGMLATSLEGMGYVYSAQHDHPEVLAIPIATNVISGTYEIGRAIYRNVQRRRGRDISDSVDGGK